MVIDHEDDENDCEDAERNREFNAAKVAALRLHESGEYKLLSKYDTCWEKAWFKAQREARSYGAIYRDNLLRLCNCGTLPEIPKAQRDTRRMISVFSVALLRMKVGKGIQMMASGDRSGLRLSHAPQWAKEVTRLNRKLKRMNSVSSNDRGELDLEDEANVEGMNGDIETGIQFGNLLVARLLTEEEEDKLDDF